MNNLKSSSGIISTALKPKGIANCLVIILILAQILLLQHVITHQLEEAIAPDNDHCIFCAVGSHAAPATVPPILPVVGYVILIYLISGIARVIDFTLPVVRATGPPSSLT